MTEHLLKIIDAIRAIDGGCSSCIIGFLARCYEIEPYNLLLVVEKLDRCGITKEDIENHTEDRKFDRENP